jgi:hypothetical protein
MRRNPMKGDVSALVGRSYIAKSGRRCTIAKLGDGALRVNWHSNPIQADRDEVNEWITSILRSQGIEPIADICEDQSQEAARYAAWKERS